ncbi:hypothetical protein V5799_004911 [Amblyomma americanum]|uniref:Sulfotransferase domain-containing protein n=1 Tax=Amblyomma americanum TaxID=6943 RepID=A0AAQ4D4S0_AMBAM
MPQEVYQEVYHEVMGLHLSRIFTERNIRSALSYEPQDGDVFVVSYPKCGSTWLQNIAQAVLNVDDHKEASEEGSLKLLTFLELVGAEGARAMPRPGAIKTHLPFSKHPYSEKAKYVYIARNPYDCCVSFYHHTKRLPTYRFQDGTFDQFFDMFVEGKVDFGDYFDNLLSWYEHRDDPNVLFVTYEELKKDTSGWVLKLADFFGKEQFGDKMKRNPALVAKVIESTNVEKMKAINSKLRNWKETVNSMPADARADLMKTMNDSFGDVWNKDGNGEFVRKGVVGDWKNYFSVEQIARLKARIELKTQGSDVMSLWTGVGLP